MLWQKMSFYEKKNSRCKMMRRLQVPCAPGWLEALMKSAVWVIKSKAGWWLLLEEPILTPPFFQLERSLLSCTGESVYSVCGSNSWPHTAQEWRQQAREMSSLRSLGLCSKETDGLTSTTSHGKSMKWSKTSLPISPLSQTQNCSDPYSATQLQPSNKIKRL